MTILCHSQIVLSGLGLAFNFTANVLLIVRFSPVDRKYWRLATTASTLLWTIKTIVRRVEKVGYSRAAHTLASPGRSPFATLRFSASRVAIGRAVRAFSRVAMRKPADASHPTVQTRTMRAFGARYRPPSFLG